MKYRIMSDIHLEFGHLEVTELPDDKESVLILAGDIGVGMSAYDFVEEMCSRFYNVIYVMGNHEFYNHDIYTITENWLEIAKHKDNLFVLDDDSVVIEDTLFLGGTMWTDVSGAGDDWFLRKQIQRSMNDFRVIAGFSVEDSIVRHNVTQKAFKKILMKAKEDNIKHNIVVITHHMPHEICISDNYRGSSINAGFCSTDLDYLFEYDIDLWIYGHTHEKSDHIYNGTRLICNPRGYIGFEPFAKDYNQELVVEI